MHICLKVLLLLCIIIMHLPYNSLLSTLWGMQVVLEPKWLKQKGSSADVCQIINDDNQEMPYHVA